MSVKNITYGQNHPHSVKATAIGKSPIINQSMIRKNNNNKLKKKKVDLKRAQVCETNTEICGEKWSSSLSSSMNRWSTKEWGLEEEVGYFW